MSKTPALPPDPDDQNEFVPIAAGSVSAGGKEAADEDLSAIIQFIRKIVGVDFSQYKMTTIRRRIVRRMLLHKLDTFRDYVQYLNDNPSETHTLYNDLLINVTSFFRDADLMDYLGDVLFPELAKRQPASEPLRIWIPACSTGQEAYSLAILLAETLGDRASRKSIHIFATDLSEAAINKARMGLYTRAELVDVSPGRLSQFFTQVDDQYRINKSIRELCVFAPHNLLQDPPFSRLDLISCRNLLIYLNSSLQRKVIASFHHALNPGGYLLLGKSEGVSASATLFSPVEKNYKVFMREPIIAAQPAFGQVQEQTGSRIRYPFRPVWHDALTPAPGSTSGTSDKLEKFVDKLLSKYVPASVVIDQDLDILLFRGSVSLFLEPASGKASLNLLKMARPALAFELQNLVQKVRRSGKTVRKTGLHITVDGKQHQVSLEVQSIKPGSDQPCYLIIFEEITPQAMPKTGLLADQANRINILQQELTLLRETMRSMMEEQETSNEELQSANEEIVSSNEDLQRINEILETSREEIESANEALQAINQELQLRNKQLSAAYEFAKAIFSTSHEAMLSLNHTLRIYNANQAFYELFQTTEEKVIGRSIYELTDQQGTIPHLHELLNNVLLHNTQVKGVAITHTFPIIGERVLRFSARKIVEHPESILLAISDITESKQVPRLRTGRDV